MINGKIHLIKHQESLGIKPGGSLGMHARSPILSDYSNDSQPRAVSPRGPTYLEVSRDIFVVVIVVVTNRGQCHKLLVGESQGCH